MVDTPDSNSGAARREGSNPSPRTCECGMTTEDYMHYGWHKIYLWNNMVFERAKQAAEKEFDALLNEREAQRRKKMPPVRTGDDSLWEK